ncbi:MAG: efflux transporter outer membrane subunit [Verrucomicrobium sp.]|nr:efflux transporter outer membrane subunit [Verrucomicrobium sp.]
MKRIPLLFSLALLAGCSVGPDYHKPAAVTAVPPGWKEAQPADRLPRGPWWELYHDAELTRLEQQAQGQNQDLRAAVARVDQARAVARLEGASFFPQLTLDAQAQRQRLTENNPTFQQFQLPNTKIPSATVNSRSVPIDLSYEIDVWGRVRRSFESSQAQAQASVADLQNILLTLQSDVAVDYLTLREYDRELAILRATVDTRKKSLEINQKRLQAGRATALDVEQAKTELANSEASLAQVEESRAHMQDALAYLCGEPASSFALAENPLPVDALPPAIPAGIPSDVLERRPDVAAAERTLKARNAQIGVATAAYFPTISLTGNYGYLSYSADNLFTHPSSVWAIGPSVSLPLFTGGKTAAQVRQAKSQYEEAVAQYRGVVLGAFRDVEDALASTRTLAKQAEATGRAAKSASHARELSEQRYKAGAVDYFEVTEEQRLELSAQRAEAQVAGQRLYASVRLVKALGGGWDSSVLKGEKPGPNPVDAP